ncbi:unnamed protein product [Macrosiphum euphorbiae]|uniref:DUF4371 domain-containing protein n=1 Tax=Macrosiphum euphorbiae TaxID=13131 RepID=A0AAV0VWP1_9HEMI|nr:unnamed protein product [Macrosiphum euphorbiae]
MLSCMPGHLRPLGGMGQDKALPPSWKKVVGELNSSLSFSLLADETSNIAGIEQLSICVRYVDSSKTIREKLIEFALQTLDAVGIATISSLYFDFC